MDKTQEFAEEMDQRTTKQLEVPIEQTLGRKEARGTTIAGTQVHSLRLPNNTIAFETIFGLPDERLTIRHDSGSGAEPYINGTLLAARQVMQVTGLVRRLDCLLMAS
jgi:4-hydroxy-tetrahydrodipicolinate reductase